MIHIHNGDSTAMTARRANIPGRHIAFRETLITGPVRAALSQHDWIEERARFLSENYDQNLLRTRTDLLDQEQMLDQARREDEVVLWFEHDLFCLINFLYLLGRLGKARHLSILWCPQPLGTMDEDELINTFNSRAAAQPAMIRAAASAWDAYTSDDATALNRFINDSGDFAFLRDGFLLHGSRFPSLRNGLGEVEKRAMEGIAAGASDFLSLFTRFDQSPPRFGFGDGEFLRHLRRLASCAIPMITITEVEGESRPKALFALTPAGQNVLDGKADFIDLNNAGFWLGGAHLTRERMWRWDEQRQEVVASHSAG
ncbi:MAG TPA: DUF1835 domain-containing protein [Thermoanaerobaculia bacterium]